MTWLFYRLKTNPTGLLWQFVHAEYDGHEDPRIGHGTLFCECINFIRDFHGDDR